MEAQIQRTRKRDRERKKAQRDAMKDKDRSEIWRLSRLYHKRKKLRGKAQELHEDERQDLEKLRENVRRAYGQARQQAQAEQAVLTTSRKLESSSRSGSDANLAK